MLLRYERKKDFLEGGERDCGTGLWDVRCGMWDMGG